MSDWLLNLPVLWMTVVILATTYLIATGFYLLVTALAAGERARAFKSISPAMLPPLAMVFALLVGFLAAQVWSDADRANGAVNREASALRAVVLLANGLPDSVEARLRELVRHHVRDAVKQEWPAMARGGATLTIVPAPLQEALHLALRFNPEDEGRIAAQREIVASLQGALEARRQRIILSRSSINWVKWTALLVQACLTLATIAMVHSDNRAANRIILAIFATGVAVAIVLIAAHSRPFMGEVSVRPSVLLQIMPEASPVPVRNETNRRRNPPSSHDSRALHRAPWRGDLCDWGPAGDGRGGQGNRCTSRSGP